MSWWIYLENDDEIPVDVDLQAEGGTYAIGGTTKAELNVTYNYSAHFRKYLPDGIDFINGKKAREVISSLAEAVLKLGTKQDADYWKPTEGNAGYALSILLVWAIYNPDATFRVS